jgi:hypothetical protein
MKKQITIRARKKAAALSAREENQKHKSNFIPASQVVTPPAGVESEARS